MKIRKFAVGFTLGLSALTLAACLASSEGRQGYEGKTERTTQARASLASRPTPLIAYLHEGSLWVVGADGDEARELAPAPEGEAITAHAWSEDGSQSFFSVGLKLFAVGLRDGKRAEVGELSAPAGTMIDRLELGRDGATLIAHALDANAELGAVPKLFAMTLGNRETRELTVDEYDALAEPQPLIIRRLDEVAVSPEGRYLLFKEVVGNDEELFVSDIETGSRHQASDLSALDGFEQSALLAGGRHILEAAWSRDGRYIIFNPAQSCSEMGLCYGRLFLVDAWGGAQFQLSREMMVNLPVEWNREGTLLVYDDGGQVVLADARGQVKQLAEGNRPKWQPVG